MNTLLLDPTSWDLVVDANSNIALATRPYSLAQDAASVIRTFLGEVYYDSTQGVPYFTRIFGQAPPPLALIRELLVQAALTVPNVVAAQVFITSLANRSLSGQVQVTDTAGVITAAGF